MPRRISDNPPQPELEPVRIPAQKLLLWPNNPRLFVGEELNIRESEFADPEVQRQAFAQMAKKGDPFRLDELKDSLRRNGFVPVDYIFVRRYGDNGFYLVLEGNRRVTAIREILQEEQLPANERQREALSEDIRRSLETVECMEIVNQLPDAELQDMVTYLLGVRHHGALKQWSPFAKAAHIHDLYVKGIGGSGARFCWDASVGDKVAEGLCVEPKEVRESVATYRVMQDIGVRPEVRDCDGISSSDFTLVKDALVTGSKAIRAHLPIDNETFTLSDDVFGRLDELCHFSKRREGAPINRPQDWSSFGKILRDEDQAKREQMLDQVCRQKESPRTVWGRRNRELQQLDWAHWLSELLVTLKRINLGGIEGNPEEREVVELLAALLEQLPRT